MIKKKIIFAALSLLITSTALAGEKTSSNLIRTNPFGLLFGTYSLGYERAMNEKITLGMNLEQSSFNINDININAQSTSVGARYYKQGFLNTSTYYSAYVGKLKMDLSGKIQTTNIKAKSDGYIVSVSGGKQYVWKSGLIMGAGFGFGYSSLEIDGDFQIEDTNKTDRVNINQENVMPFIDLSIGYQF